MKYKYIVSIIAICSLFVCSCDVFSDKEMAKVVIYGNSISGKYDILGFEKEEQTNTFAVKTWPEYFSDAEAVNRNFLIGSVRYGEPIKMQSGSPSKEELFAFERVTERNRDLVDNYEKYCRPMIESGELRNNTAISSFVSAYVLDLPTITADDILFGQPAGTDITEWFRFKDPNLVAIIGMDYKMEGRYQDKDKYLPASDFFIKDKMLPFVLYIAPIETPSEISIDNLPNKWWYNGDDIITLTVSIPVRFEQYWDWCKALYSDPNAVEVIKDGIINVKIPLVRKK